MKFYQLTLACVLLAGLALGEYKSYAGYKVLRVEVPNEASALFLRRFEDLYDFWTDIRIGRNVDIMIPPGNGLPNLLKESGYKFSTMIEDLQPLIEAQFEPAVSSKQQASWWDSYHDYDEITAKMEELANGSEFATIETIGQSYEGRDMKVVKVCSTTACGTTKPGMYIEAGIHAREWISPAVATWMLNELLNNPENANYVRDLDWYFLANTNPDGYAYTWTDDRMWRKTRSLNDESTCHGTDPNRNFDRGFGGIGSSNLPCSDTYHGTAAFSEIETANVRDFVLRTPNLKFFNDLHSYSQEILLPFGYKTDEAADHTAQMAVAKRGAEAITATHGKTYIYGDTYNTIYPASGIALDWGYEGAGIKYAISVELRDKGLYGFQLPADQIIDTGEEMWAMHIVYADQVISEGL